MLRIEFDFKEHFAATTGLHAIDREVSALKAMAVAVEKVLAPAAEQIKTWWEGKVEQITFKISRVTLSFVTRVDVEIRIDKDTILTTSMNLGDVDVEQGKVIKEHVIINLLKTCSDHFLGELAKGKPKKK